jgi:hypothetical protein
MCFIGYSPDEGRAERGDDKDSPDRRSCTVDCVDTRFCVRHTSRPLTKLDPRVRLLDCPEGRLVTSSERTRNPSGPCESLGGASRVSEALHVHRSTRVQVPDERLVSVVPLPPGCEPAKGPDGDRDRESQEQKTRGEPQTAAGDAPYFLPPLYPFPPPCTFGGVVGEGAGALGACFACPRVSPWWCSLE